MENLSLINLVISVIVPVFITSGVSLWLGREQNKRVKVDIAQTYQKMLQDEIGERERLSKRVDDLIEDRERLSGRVDELARENRLLQRAFNRAVKYIRENINHQQIPDFLEDKGE